MALDPAVRAEIVKEYPSLSRMLDIPGLGEFLIQMYDEGVLGGSEFQDKFLGSDWFRNHAAARREWIVFQERDPATAALDLQNQASDIQNMASQAGIQLDASTIREMANTVLEWGLDEGDILSMLAAEGAEGQLLETGSIASTATDIKQRASQYFVNMSDTQANYYANEIFAGRLTIDGVYNQLHADAREFYPQYADSLDRGLTLDAATYSLRTHVAGLMNTTAEAVDLTDQRYSHLIDYTDPETGDRRQKNLTEINKWGRQQEEYRTGEQGMAEGSSLAMNFLQIMGKARR